MSNRVPIVVHEVNVRHTVILAHLHILHHESKCKGIGNDGVVPVGVQRAQQCNPVLFVFYLRENTHKSVTIQMMTSHGFGIGFQINWQSE
jgi:hypothetical protein